MENIGTQFIEFTKYPKMFGASDQSKGMAQPLLELKVSAKKEFPLPPPDKTKLLEISLKNAIAHRTSCRDFSRHGITISELSYLLWSTQGVKEIMGGNYATIRTVPSAGARHAIETFVTINNVEGLPKGIYKYGAVRRSLSLISDDEDANERLYDICLQQEMVKQASAVFIWVAVPYRMTWRYGVRGYRYILLDAGHVCQNLYLSAQDINCGVCAIGAFDDDQMDDLLNLEKGTQFSIYSAVVGKT